MALEAARFQPAEAVKVVQRYRADELGSTSPGMHPDWHDRREGMNITPGGEPIPTDVRRLQGLDELPGIGAAGGPLPRGEGSVVESAHSA
jgi:hypothetical protein